MSLQIRILGAQKEPTMLQKGMEISDFTYRTRDPEAFEKGKILVENFINDNGFEPTNEEFSVIDDPMQITLGEVDDTGKYSLNDLALSLEKLGFFGKSANYRPVQFCPDAARAFNRAVSDEDNINDDGSINWNFVDADFYMAMDIDVSDSTANKNHYQTFNSLAIQYDLANALI